MRVIHSQLPVFKRVRISGTSILFLLILTLIVFGQNDSLRSNETLFTKQLNALIQETIKANPDLQAAQSGVNAAKAEIKSVSLDPPQLGVEFFDTPVSSFPNPFRGQMEIDYSLQQMIPFPGKLSAMSEAQLKRAKMLEADKQTIKQDLILSVKRSFYELYLIDRKLDINSTSRVVVRTFIDIARKRYELGTGMQTDILRAQTEYSSLINDSIALGQNRLSITAMINAVSNRPMETQIPYIPEIAPAVSSMQSLDSLLTIADNNRPELKSMQYNIAMQSSELTSARKEFYPDFMVRGMYKQMIDRGDKWALMLGISLPIAPWSLGKYSSSVNRADARVDQASAQYTNMRNMVALQIQDAIAKVHATMAQVNLIYNTTIPQARQTMQSALAGYQNGTVDFLMLIDSERMLLMALEKYHMAVMNLLTNETNLKRAAGILD